MAGVLPVDRLVAFHQHLKVVAREVHIVLDAPLFLERFDRFLEMFVRDAHHDIPEHVDEPAVGVIGEAHVAGAAGQPFRNLVVHAQIQHGIHHARHRDRRAAAHGNKQRIIRIAQLGLHVGLETGNSFFDLFFQSGRPGVSLRGIILASLGGDGASRRHRQANGAHLSQIGPLATQQGFHASVAFRTASPETVYIFDCSCCIGLCVRFHGQRAGCNSSVPGEYRRPAQGLCTGAAGVSLTPSRKKAYPHKLRNILKTVEQ